jgi:ABC-type nitrate/sulfonate/bicarbonate transport system substrate-binding protein
VAQFSLVVPQDSPIKTLGDLRGKAIGITGPGALSELTLLWGLRKAGMDPTKDISRVALGSLASLSAGLENGKIEAGMLADPALLQGLTTKKLRAVGDWARTPYPGDVFVVRSTDLQTRREEFVRFHAVFVEAMRRMKDPTFAFRMARLRYPHNFTDDELKLQLADQIAAVWRPMDGVLTEALYRSASDMWVGSGRFKAEDIPSYANLVDNLATAQ